MMRKYIGFLILLIFVLGDGNVVAQSLGESFFDNGSFFKITSLSPRRVSVVHPPAGDPSFVHYTGVVCVPDTVWYTPTKPFQVYAVADSAFFNCSTVTKVELPATLRSIGVDAFSGTSSLDTLRCYGEIPPVMYYDSINSRSSMGNLSPGSDYYRWRDHIVLRTPCSGIDNYTMSSGWSIFSHFAGENMHMLYEDSICSGENYYLHQFALDRPVSGIYQLSNLSGGLTGCTYDAELHLVVNPTYENVFAYYFCDETSLSYNAHGFNVNNWTRGENTWTNYNTTVNGCDSISRLQFRRMLSVNDFYDSVCAGAPYSRTFGTLRFDLLASETAVPDTDIVLHKDFTPAGDALTSYQVGCSQTITDHIHVNPIIHDTLVANSCEGYPYTWKRTGYNASRTSVTHTNTYSVSGFHRDTLFSQKGCLMYKNLDLHIWQPSDTVLYDTICGNECTLFGSNYISTHGVHTAQYANQHWCDSTVALHLTVRDSYSDQHSGYTQVPIYHTDFNQTENRYAWIFANGSNGWRIKDGYLRVSSGANTNNYNLNVQSDSYASITFNTGDYDSIRIEMPVTVGGESYNDYLKVFLPGTTTSTSYFNTNFSYSSTYKNTRHNQVDTLKLYWHNNANGRGNQEAVRINELTITGISHQLRNHPTTQLNADICEGDTYSEGGHLYSTTGTYLHDYATSVYGCDSLVRLDLKVHENRDTTFEAAFCNGGGLVFDGVTYTQTTFVTNNYEDQWGCDSIRNLDLTVWPTPTTEIDTVHLGDAPLLFRGQSITEDGSYTFVDTTIHGCDSIVKLNVTIHHNQYTTIPAEICDDETYNANGFNVSEPGIYYDTLRTVFGADSIVKLILVVHPTYNKNFYADICEGESYIFNSHTMIATGSVTDNLMTVYGCDSVVTQHLTVHPIYATTIDTTIWGDEPFDFHGTMVSESGTYHKSYVTQQGCDSLFTLNITIYHNADTIINASICEGDTYSDNGFDASIAGTYTRHTSTVTGADSTITLHLIVNPVYDDTLGATICDRETYSFGINSYGVAGHYTDSLHTYRGCDSVVTLALKVNPVFDTVIYDTVRGDEGYWFYGAHYDSTGVYRDTLPNRYLCDSITELHLQIYPTKTEHIYDTICQGQTYTLHDFNENTTGVFYRHGLFTVVGHSDSTAVLHLCVNPVYDDTLGATICDRETYSFGINSYGVAGHYTDSLHTYRGCDSVVTLALKVNPVFDTVIYDTVRGDEGYWFYDVHYDSTGIYRDTTYNRYLCDSITELHLQIYPTRTEHIYDTICQGQTYTLHDFNESTTGVFYRHGLFTVVGHSDSTAVLHLCVNPVYDDTLVQHICDRTVYTGFGNHQLSTTGFTTDSLLTYRMCDSVVTLHLIVDPVYEVHVYDTVRGDEGYMFLGRHLDTTGVYCDTLPTQQGCDSIIFLHLQIYNTATTHLYDTICQAQIYNNYGFIGQTESGTYQRNLFTFGGADSTVFLHLWVNPIYDDTLVQHICDRTIYTGFGNHQLSTTGFTTDSLQTYRMCDSVVTLHLIVDPVYEVDVYDTLRGDGFYDFLGTLVNETGIYCDTLPTVSGCDSIIHLHLKVYKNAYTTLYDTICDRDEYNGFGFSGLVTAGIYVDSLFTYGGADSVVTLHLWVNPVYEVHEYDTICSNRFLLHHNDTLRFAGDYTDTLPTIHGCDSIITMHLFVLPSYDDTFRAEICQGGSYFFHVFEPLTEEGLYRYFMKADNSCDSIETLWLTVHPTYNYTIQDSILPTENYLFGNRMLYDPGFYTDSLTSQYGCDSIVNLQLSNWYLHTTRLHDTICDGDSIFFNDSWCKRDSVYTDTLMADDGMDSLVVLFLKVSPVYNDTIYDSIFCTQFCVFGNDSLNVEGFYTHYLETSWGCDSTVTLNLYVHTTRDLDSSVCMDRLPFLWNGITFPDTIVTDPIVYRDTAIVWNDSANRNIMLAMNVTVVPNPIQTIADTIVENQLPYTFRGYVYDNNVEADTLLLPATVGCDTTTYYSLFYFPNVADTVDTTICYGQLPIEWNGVSFNAPEGVLDITQTTTLLAHTGADSVLTMRVHVLQNTYTTRRDTVVENMLPYEVHGHIYFNACNLDTLVIPNSAGCDSVIYFRLLVNGNGVTMIDTTLCDYLLPINWNGHNFDDDGSTDLLSDTTIYLNQFGADSMVIMRVHILRCTSQVFDSTVCSAQLPLMWNGRTFNIPPYMPTTVVDTIHLYTPTGADSLIILRLHVNETFNQTFYDTICSNHPYTFLGQQYATSCILSANLHTYSGCDSNVVVHLQVWPTETSMFEDVICPATTYGWIDGNSYTEPVVGPFSTLRTVHGCDSTVYLHLVEGEAAVADIWADKSWVEVDDPVVRLADHTLHGESRVWHFPDSTSTQEVVYYTYPNDYDSVRIFLVGTNHDGCVDTTSVLLRLDRDFIGVPNVFTPGLSENNHFSVIGKGLINVEVSIFTRTGLFIYSWQGMDGYWDGTYNGEICPQAAYTYKVTYSTERNPRDRKTKVGTVVLLR